MKVKIKNRASCIITNCKPVAYLFSRLVGILYNFHFEYWKALLVLKQTKKNIYNEKNDHRRRYLLIGKPVSEFRAAGYNKQRIVLRQKVALNKNGG